MDKERLKQIGKFLNDRIVIHRNIENDTPWTTEEKMIQELYDNYLDLLIQLKEQKEAINIVYDILNNFDAWLEIQDLMKIRKCIDILKEVSE